MSTTPLHPAPLSFSPHPPAQHRPELTARPPERRLDPLHRRRSLPSEPSGEILVASSSNWCFPRAIWCPGGHFGISPASRRRLRRPSPTGRHGRPMKICGPD
jgi:hypothetical protein